MNPNDSKISTALQEWQNGNQEALNALLEKHLPWVHRQVRKKLSAALRRRGETIDYVQDAVVQFLRFGPRFSLSSEKAFCALLLKIATNLLNDRYNWLTALRRNINREKPNLSETVLSLDPPREKIETPSRYAVMHEQEGWVHLGLQFLEPADREVLVLRLWERLPFVEIGKRFRITANAAWMKHNRAIERLGDKIWDLRSGRLNELLDTSEA